MTIAPTVSETPVIDERDACSPKKYPSDVIMIAHSVDAIRKRSAVSLGGVFASPATIGMNAFTDGISLPKKMYHMPRFAKTA